MKALLSGLFNKLAFHQVPPMLLAKGGQRRFFRREKKNLVPSIQTSPGTVGFTNLGMRPFKMRLKTLYQITSKAYKDASLNLGYQIGLRFYSSALIVSAMIKYLSNLLNSMTFSNLIRSSTLTCFSTRIMRKRTGSERKLNS